MSTRPFVAVLACFVIPRIALAQAPAPSTDAVKMEVHLLTYEAMRVAAGEIACRVKCAGVTASDTIQVCTDPKVVQDLHAYTGLTERIDALNAAFAKALDTPEVDEDEGGKVRALISGVGDVLQDVTDLSKIAGLFQTTTVLKGESVTPTEPAMGAILVAELRRAGLAAEFPYFQPPGSARPSQLRAGLANLDAYRLQAVPHLGKNTTNPVLTALDKAAGDLASALNAPGAEARTPLSRFLLLEPYASRGGCLLQVFTVVAGGNNRATSNPFAGPRLKHSGGVVLAYALVDPQGKLLATDVLQDYGGYVKNKKFATRPRRNVPTCDCQATTASSMTSSASSSPPQRSRLRR